jgi:ADP-heptose:LPS heptosyltransferase
LEPIGGREFAVGISIQDNEYLQICLFIEVALLMRNEEMKPRWLIYRNGAVGDTVLLSSVIQKIRSFSPGAWIEVMGIQERVALLVGLGGADRVVSSEMPGIESLYGTGPVQGSFRKYLESFTHILWYSAGDSGILHPRIQQRPEQFVSVFPALPAPDYDDHAIQHYCMPLQPFCTDSYLPHPAIVVDPHAVEMVRNRISPSREPVGISIITLHAGAGSKTKIADFSYLFNTLLSKMDAISQRNKRRILVVLPLGPADSDVVPRCQDVVESVCQTLVMNYPSLQELACLLSISDYYIGNDSGVSHIAEAVGCPMTVFFTASNPHVWAPLGDHVEIVQLPVGQG